MASGGKRITLIRHAKSSWKITSLSDFDRPLNKRGKQNAPEMAARLKLKMSESGNFPQLIISSGARRALNTAGTFRDKLELKASQLKVDNTLYMAGPGEVRSMLRNLDPEIEHVALVFHNPGITDVANHLQNDLGIYNIPTSGIITISFENATWDKIFSHRGKVDYFMYPKKDRVYASERKPDLEQKTDLEEELMA